MIDKALMKERIEGTRNCWLSIDQVREMKEAVDNIVIWHPFPQDKPPTHTWYLVTVSESMDGSGPRGISMMYYTKKGYFDDYSFGVTERTVVAWAEKPEAPFK